MSIRNYGLITILVVFSQCGNQQKPAAAPDAAAAPVAAYKTMNTTYYALTVKDSIKKLKEYYSAPQLGVILAVNRTDADNIGKFDTVIVPRDMSGAVIQYSPYPQSVAFLKDINKIVLFSYAAEYFAAYANGVLVRSGPTNMGRQKDPTPTGLFYANWKAEETKSTFNDEWELKWNFNIQNKEGVGWHQYALPGYPASHSCLRLQEEDAKYLYTWADQWVVKGTDNILANGTPTVVYGTYPFGSPKPWLRLLQDPHAMDITAEQLEKECTPFLSAIKAEQVKREGRKGE